ncbi:TMEM165/GDT1 family protein [Acinetobacter sp. ME22]|uniref:TMEM165/GDT1 family protein n=1 Tax=Acinetobacter sp. ME22 TaxID=2904802 RepID=UPI001EDB3CAD|nr:TMEM165/GDT1 family protein [Acinetobacter sp. ME22]MCG2573386.1 TMEM165/GDT1 family protein [Acinetobacter sp. ME22]
MSTFFSDIASLLLAITGDNKESLAFISSLGGVFIAEIGDKTQLLALLLAARFRKPIPILIAILAATTLNHGLSAVLGQWLADIVPKNIMVWILALGFIGMAVWMLIPDSIDEEDDGIAKWQHLGVFGATFILFFLAEIGDKTQIATVALAAQFNSVFIVMLGTTVGMMLADGPAVFVGNKMADKLPISLIHKIGAFIFLAVGIFTLAQHYWSSIF